MKPIKMEGVKDCTECPLLYIGKKRRNCNIEMCKVMTHEHSQLDVDFFIAFHKEISRFR